MAIVKPKAACPQINLGDHLPFGAGQASFHP